MNSYENYLLNSVYAEITKQLSAIVFSS